MIAFNLLLNKPLFVGITYQQMWQP